jgi:hypothetical protein
VVVHRYTLHRFILDIFTFFIYVERDENNKIIVIVSERGKKLANVGAFKYRFIGS